MTRRRRLAALVLAAALAAACARDAAAPPAAAGRTARVRLSADLGLAPVAVLAVTVSAADIAVPLAFNLAVAAGVASGDVDLPVGAARTVTVRAFDDRGLETHRGAATIDVGDGRNAPLAIALDPLVGDLPIVVRVGPLTVTVAPAVDTLRAGEQRPYVAVARDELGAVVAASFRWAATRPPVAVVGAGGLVTALDTGGTAIGASTAGFGASAALRVIPGTTLERVRFAPAALPAAGGAADVEVDLRDAGAGADSVRVALASPAGLPGPGCTARDVARGTRRQGTFRCRLVLPAGAAAGDWGTDTVRVFGTVRTTYDAALLAASGRRARLPVAAP